MNPHTNAARKQEVEKVCDFLNQRFGYQYALQITLESIGIKKEMIGVLLKLARNRNIDEFRELLKAAA